MSKTSNKSKVAQLKEWLVSKSHSIKLTIYK